MPYPNQKNYQAKGKKNKKENIIPDTYDIRFPHPVFSSNKKTIIGYGCTICEVPPMYCPSFDAGIECTCDCCDMKTDYKPKKIYKNIKTLLEHYGNRSHNLSLTTECINFIQNKISLIR
jgi:hypothetical protein